MSLDLKSLMYYNNASTGKLTMDFIKELTEPKTLSDGTVRMPNSAMKRAARVIEEQLAVRKGLEAALHTANCNAAAIEELARREIVKMEERLRNMASQVLGLESENGSMQRMNKSLKEEIDWYKKKWDEVCNNMKESDMTEFHEINNKDRE